jgi:CDP-6-deoxy-D-xylo-4-hexulose-3-dehydrase
MGRSHGWDRSLDEDSQKELRLKYNVDDFHAKYTFYDLASNFRPTEINGFIGNLQIGYWDEIVTRRANNFAKFQKVLDGNDDFYSYDLSHMDVISNFSMPLICKTLELADKYKSRFEEAKVEIRPVIAGNITRQPFYIKYIKADESSHKNSDIVHNNGFYFGNNPEMTDEEVATLCNLMKGKA